MLNTFFLFPRTTLTTPVNQKSWKSPILEDPQTQNALLRKAIHQIWHSLELQESLQAAVDELATLLGLDRCSFLWCWSETQQVQVVCEHAQSHHPSQIGEYPLQMFGEAAGALMRGDLIVRSGSGPSRDAFTSITRLIARWQGVEPPSETCPVLGAPASLLVPVKGDEGCVGFLACLADQPRSWSTAEIGTVQLIAQQLEIAIRQAQLYKRIQQQAQRERLVNQITAQTRQSFDLETILTQAIAQLLEALEVDRCIVHLVEDTSDRQLRDSKQLSDYFWETSNGLAFRRRHLFEVCREPYPATVDDFDTHGPITQWVIQNGQAVVIADVTQDPRIGSQNEEYQKAQIKSSLVIPVQAHGKLYAILYLNQCSRLRNWSQSVQEFAQTVADQLAISIQQASLFVQTRRQMERESLLRLISDQIRSTLDLNTILQTVVEQVQQFLNTGRVAIYQFTQEGQGQIVVEKVTGECPSLLNNPHQDATFPQSYAAAYQEGHIQAVNDILEAALPESYVSYLQRLQVRANLVVPIGIGDRIWGLLVAHECQGPRIWKPTEVELLQQLAAQLAIAIQQAELYSQVQTAATTAQTKAAELEQALCRLQQTQTQLIQSEKMSSLGQMVAGIAHEINNPVNFIHGNINYASNYAQDLLDLVALYQKHYPQPDAEILDHTESIELDFLAEDLPRLLHSMKMGTDRIRQIVLSLRNFSRLDEAEVKSVEIHEGIENTLLILQNRLKPKPQCPGIQIVKEYGQLPLVECHAGQLNQVFMNIFVNAIDALENLQPQPAEPKIWVRTETLGDRVLIEIQDNGPGMTAEVQKRLFDPFFTTKPVGQGTGLGLSISYQIVAEKHRGSLQCISQPGAGAKFQIEIPVKQV